MTSMRIGRHCAAAILLVTLVLSAFEARARAANCAIVDDSAAQAWGVIEYYYCDAEVTDAQCESDCENSTNWATYGQIYGCWGQDPNIDCHCGCW